MFLSAPTKPVFIVSLVLAIFAVLVFLRVVPFTAVPVFWIMTAAYVVLLIGNLFKKV